MNDFKKETVVQGPNLSLTEMLQQDYQRTKDCGPHQTQEWGLRFFEGDVGDR